jgi:hypothetical protein
MRRKPMHSGGRQNNNGGGGHGGGQRRSGGGSGGGYNNNRSRKNYPQLREKYLNQAKDALSGGDRVMAEYYFQHADHCYRMMVEEGYRPQTQQQMDAQQDAQDSQQQNSGQMHQVASSAEDNMPDANALPTFLTMGYTAAAGVQNTEQAAAAPAQGQWEEN